ncbi:MAG: hypothetical protein EBR10_05625 [Planctomycetes bacterium]|nr:hypothetical protein [Planctomycetota bacterium]
MTAHDSNLFAWDYRALAAQLGEPIVPIIDAHAHVAGLDAAPILKEAMDLYGIEQIWSMTSNIDEVEGLRGILGDRIAFIAIPNWRATDLRESHGHGYAQQIRRYHALGARVAKFWAAPRGIDMGLQAGDPALMRLDNPVRVAAIETAVELGMTLMVHVADPDTWFATKYADAAKYGSKRQQYEPLEALMQRFPVRWIAAHMGGWPEDLAFLDGLLERHPNLVLDASATKWIVREMSRHPRERVLQFFTRWRERLLFGSDIVTSNAHLTETPGGTEMDSKAQSRESAFDLYASRYWALRTLWETAWSGRSPIADGDLALVDPSRSPKDSPMLRGVKLPRELLLPFVRENAERIMREAMQGGVSAADSNQPVDASAATALRESLHASSQRTSANRSPGA